MSFLEAPDIMLRRLLNDKNGPTTLGVALCLGGLGMVAITLLTTDLPESIRPDFAPFGLLLLAAGTLQALVGIGFVMRMKLAWYGVAGVSLLAAASWVTGGLTGAVGMDDIPGVYVAATFGPLSIIFGALLMIATRRFFPPRRSK